jgi:hypothetical protein
MKGEEEMEEGEMGKGREDRGNRNEQRGKGREEGRGGRR